MGLINTSSSNNYINSNYSQFISSQQLNNILKQQKSTDIYQSQISQNMYHNNYRQNTQQSYGYHNQYRETNQQYTQIENNIPYNSYNREPYNNQQTNQYHSYSNQNNQYQNQPRYTNNPQSSSSQYLKKVIAFTQGSQSIQDYLNTLNQIGKHVECQNLYLPILCKVSGQQTTCSDYRKLQMYYQNYDVKITDQIAARKRQKQMFAEQQVWYILYSILNACRKFQKFHMSSGNLKTQHVLLNDKGHIKVINKLSFPHDQKDEITPLKQSNKNQINQSRYSNNSHQGSDLKSLTNCLNPTKNVQGYPKNFVIHSNKTGREYNSTTNYNQHNNSFISNNSLNSNFYKNQFNISTFYSPQQLRIMRQSIQKVVNHNISQTYSIGIIIFEICTFISGERVYDMNHLTINQPVLKKGQEIMNSKYSKLLNNLIKTMLSNAYDRPLPSQIYSAFKPYEKRILNLKPFKFDVNSLKETLPMSQVSSNF